MGYKVAEKLSGTITRWQDDKGFGFIQTETSDKELFFHISDYRAKASKRPTVQENVIFELGKDKKGQTCAKNVQQASFVQRQVKHQNSRSENHHRALQTKQLNEIGINVTLIFGIGFLAILAGLSFANVLPVWVLAWYAAINLATFLLYAHDKNAAQTGSWRVQEATLHKLALAGGWLGASLAHKILRHKSQKPAFRQLFYLTLFGNLLLLGGFWYFKLK